MFFSAAGLASFLNQSFTSSSVSRVSRAAVSRSSWVASVQLLSRPASAGRPACPAGGRLSRRPSRRRRPARRRPCWWSPAPWRPARWRSPWRLRPAPWPRSRASAPAPGGSLQAAQQRRAGRQDQRQSRLRDLMRNVAAAAPAMQASGISDVSASSRRALDCLRFCARWGEARLYVTRMWLYRNKGAVASAGPRVPSWLLGVRCRPRPAPGGGQGGSGTGGAGTGRGGSGGNGGQRAPRRRRGRQQRHRRWRGVRLGYRRCLGGQRRQRWNRRQQHRRYGTGGGGSGPGGGAGGSTGGAEAAAVAPVALAAAPERAVRAAAARWTPPRPRRPAATRAGCRSASS